MPRRPSSTSPPRHPVARRICFVTGSRAEFGLMRSTLEAIRAHIGLRLQIVATGMHLSRSRGRTLTQLRHAGFHADRTIPWPASEQDRASAARRTGSAMAALAKAYAALKPDIVLVTGDRVEAFAAAAAAHIAGIVVAHVHGGDRALGQVDDALRHAITKLSHIHFPATIGSARRIARLGEDRWRIHRVGSPGLDDIRRAAAPWTSIVRAVPGLHRGRYALLVLHPASPDPTHEHRAARAIAQAALNAGFGQLVIIYPNNDPGSDGIVRAWKELTVWPPDGVVADRLRIFPDLARPLFLGLMRDAAALIGNSSAGIIEAATFGTPVLDIGPRQTGRERSANVRHVVGPGTSLRRHLAELWNGGRPQRIRCVNVYGAGSAGGRIADHLARIALDERLRHKLIAY